VLAHALIAILQAGFLFCHVLRKSMCN